MGGVVKLNYTKKGKLSNRIICKENILEIASFFEKLCKENDSKASFEVIFRDKSSISDDSAAVFENHIIKRKDVETIHFSYSDYKNRNYVEVSLNEAFQFSNITNTYEIRSRDEKWYNAIQKELEDVLIGLPKQNFFRHCFKVPWCLITFILFLIGSSYLMTLLGFEFGDVPSKSTSEVKVFIPVSLWVMGELGLFTMVVTAVRYLWPEMEFSLDSPMHIKRKKSENH